MAAWVRRRQGVDTLPIDLVSRRLYIVPTRAGLGFAVLLVFMLLAGLNYANSVALFLTFLLGGVALAAMHLCHRNLLGARVLVARSEPAFAGSTARLEVAFTHASRAPRHAWTVEALGCTSDAAEIPPGAARTVSVSIPVAERGVLPIDRIRLTTRFPFGLFRAWTWLHLPIDVVVYPAAKGRLAPHGGAGASQGSASVATSSGDDEWQGLRDFRDGDTPRSVAWKAFARGGPLLVKEYAAAAGADRIFAYDRLRGLRSEARLEQLCRWIVDAEQRGERYGLKLPGLRVDPGAGVQHRHRCLEALARFDGARSNLRAEK